jgi:capsid protein
MRTELHGAAAGMGITYEGMTGDYSQVNFSSARMGAIEFGRMVEQLQYQLIIPVLCSRVWGWFFDMAKIAGIVPRNTEASATWTAPRREFVDPLKEVKALLEQVRAGFIPWQEAVRLLGYDPEEVRQQAAEDSQQFEALGLKPTSDPKYDTNRVEQPPQNDETDE